MSRYERTGLVGSVGENAKDWEMVREAIVQRWPQIGRDELRSCGPNEEMLVEFLEARVGASRSEIESVVHEFSPESDSTLAAVAGAAGQQYERAADAVGHAYRQTERQIQKHPTEASIIAFLSGAVVGILATIFVFNSRTQPTVWQRVKDNRWMS